MPALTPEQEILQTFAVRAIGGDPWYTVDDLLLRENGELRLLVQDANFIAAARPTTIHAILAQLEAAQEVSADLQQTQAEAALQALADQAQELDMGYGKVGLPSTPLPSFARLGRYGELSIPFRDWWTTPNSKTNVAPRNFMDENSARAAWFAALQQPPQADTDKLLSIIACAYQIAGWHDAPAHILDVLSDPEAATMDQVEAMLPYQPGIVQAAPDGWRDLIEWLLGKNGPFPTRNSTTEGLYWWRKELRARYEKLTAKAAPGEPGQ
jgi:hypothetical protein